MVTEGGSNVHSINLSYPRNKKKNKLPLLRNRLCLCVCLSSSSPTPLIPWVFLVMPGLDLGNCCQDQAHLQDSEEGFSGKSWKCGHDMKAPCSPSLLFGTPRGCFTYVDNSHFLDHSLPRCRQIFNHLNHQGSP